MDGTYWVVDTEGNGANPNEPIELGMVEMEGFSLTGKAHVWRFRPVAPVTYYANRVHGISNSDLRGCPTFKQVSDEIAGILGRHPIIGHSVAVELNMLEPRLPGWMPRAAYDTLKIARRLLPEQRQHKLQVLSEQFDLSAAAIKMTGKKPHNALYDSVVTALLLEKLQQVNPQRFGKIFENSDSMASRRAKQLRDERRARNREMREQVRGQR